MCIIIYKKSGTEVKDEWLKNSAKSNADGFGLSYMDGDKLTIYRSMSYKKFKKTFRRLESSHPESDFILHFRKNTVGSSNVENCHPFMADGKAVFHNGTISPCVPFKTDTREKRSDTRIFAEDVLSNLPKGWFENEAMLDVLEVYIGSSKLAVMDEVGTVVLFNEFTGHWYEGLWMSNYSYYPNTRSVQKTKPLTWDSNLHKQNGSNDTSNKAICYKHSCGAFTKLKDGRRFKWYQAMFMWGRINSKGEVVHGGNDAEYSDPPTYRNYRIITVDYTIGGSRQNPKVLELPFKKNEEETYECEWCGDINRKSDLKLYRWDEVNDEQHAEDVYLVCNTCLEDVSIETFMSEATDINIEYQFSRKRESGGMFGVI